MLQAVKSLFRKKAFIPIYNIHSYLQRSQIYNHFLKALFCCWFFHKDEQLYKNDIQKKNKQNKTVTEDFPLETGMFTGRSGY